MNYDRDVVPGARGLAAAMYPAIYWAGIATLVFWTAYSAYSAIIGL